MDYIALRGNIQHKVSPLNNSGLWNSSSGRKSSQRDVEGAEIKNPVVTAVILSTYHGIIILRLSPIHCDVGCRVVFPDPEGPDTRLGLLF